MRQLERSAENEIEGLVAAVIEHERRVPIVSSKCQRPSRPLGIKVGRKRVFVLEPLAARGSRSLSDEHQNRDCIAELSGPGQNELSAVPQRLQLVSGEVHHGWLLSSRAAYNRIVLPLARGC